MTFERVVVFVLIIHVFIIGGAFAATQPGGTIHGSVTVGNKETPVRAFPVVLVQLNRTVETNEDGEFEFPNVPPGQYDVLAVAAGINSDSTTVTVRSGATATVEIRLKPASGVPANPPSNELDSFQLADKTATGLGEVLGQQPGISKRSFGPGAARPVFRGFDGDRVLVLQDGVRTGTLSSQPGEHGEPMDVLGLERLELLKGPETLLYGSNVLGGIVNAISGHHQLKEESEPGFHASITGLVGSESHQGAGALGFEYRLKNWLAWGSSSNQKTGDYKTARGTVQNSGSRLTGETAGLGWYGKTRYGAASYEYGDGVYGIPLGPGQVDDTTGETISPTPVRLDFFRRNIHLSGGAREFVPFFEAVRASLNYTSWNHRENVFPTERAKVATTFENKDYTLQTLLDQKKRNRLSGTVGVYGTYRTFFSGGENAIAPPVKQSGVAAFALEQLAFESFSLQFGGRVEHTRYRPRQVTQETPAPPSTEDPSADPPPEPAPPLPQHKNRDFTSGSGTLGINIPTWRNGTVTANYTHSNRAPALEELYNNGPHAGNLRFEIGNEDLVSERNDSVELSVRHMTSRVRARGAFFLYQLNNFVYFAPTGNQNGNLTEAAYQQGDARYSGAEGSFDYQLRPVFRSIVWVNGAVDYVRAELRETNTPLPRIPPLRGHLGFHGNYRGVLINPEVVVAQAQNRVFQTETPTAGYTVFNVNASYVLARQHTSHHFGLSLFNLGDRFYTNHVSFIKEIAPEPGRGVKIIYSVKFF